MSERNIIGRGTPESVWLSWLAGLPLPVRSAAELVGTGRSVHIIAPHPDDEILGCAGIMRQLSRRDIQLHIWAVTDGEASHQGSPQWPAPALAEVRTSESETALRRLSVSAQRHRLALPDGAVAEHEDRLSTALQAAFRAKDTVIAPWRLDGHPDHEAVARASLKAAQASDCTFLEIPIWGWHWANPLSAEFPAHRAVAISLNAQDCSAKAHALQSFRTQLEPDLSTGRMAILQDFALQRFLRTFEVVLT